jgi:two-component system C4-dicarboxylate transport response regulator DctD
MMILSPEETTTEGACLLIVDDDEGVRENLGELFELAGYTILTAGNAAEALEKLGQNDVNLLVTDYRMPGRNGVELIESAIRMKPGLRAILMTAFGDTFTEIESVRRGAIGYVNKPFEADEITDLVSRILAMRGA